MVPRVYSLLDKNIVNQTGGSEKQVYLIARALAKDPDFDVNFLIADYGQEEIVKRENINFYRSFSFKENRIKAFIKLYRTLKKIDAGIYIFRAPDFGVFTGISMVKYLLKKKTVYMLASHVEMNFDELRSATSMATALTMGFVHKRADRITAQNLQQKQLFEQSRKRKVDAMIPNVIEKNKFPDNSHQRDMILWVGRCIPLKRPELFLIQAKSYPDEKFVMICPPSSDMEYFECIRAQAELIPNLEFIEYVNPSDMHDYYLKSKIYLLTSEAEGFSNTMMEAMMSGTAVVSLSVNPDNIFEQYKLGLYSNNKVGEFVTNVELLINDPEKCKIIVQNAKDYIDNNHIETKIIVEFKKLLQSMS